MHGFTTPVCPLQVIELEGLRVMGAPTQEARFRNRNAKRAALDLPPIRA